jgi:hypothetical protein
MTHPTCLFTGEALAPPTKYEHTIPQSVGGRIKSKRVSSNRFNQAAGNGVDLKIARVFAPGFNRLGLSTPSSHKVPTVPAFIRGDKGQYEFDKQGRFSRKRDIEERDPHTHKVISVVGRDPIRIARRFDRPMKFELVPPPKLGTASVEVPLFDVDVEIAALKSILLTFDHLLLDRQNRFTRTSNLSMARDLVKNFVLHGKLDDTSYEKIVLGIQYDKINELQQLRNTSSKPSTPFEHVMVVSANQSTRTVDAVWCIAGIDPYGFRLCGDWREAPFTFLLVSGILKGTDTSIELLPRDFNCKLVKQLRSRQTGQPSEQMLKAAAGEISVHHRDAWERAIDHAERNCPEFVRDGVIRQAQISLQEHGDGRIVIGLIRYLELAFEWRLTDPAKKLEFDRIIKTRTSAAKAALLKESVTGIMESPALLTWDEWHRLFVDILDDLRVPLGLPGEVSLGETVIEITKNERDQSAA